MARKQKPRSIFDAHMKADRLRQELHARRLRHMNKNAARSILDNANVLQTGATINTIKGAVLPALIADAESKLRRRGGR
jgi:hypothetical protein